MDDLAASILAHQSQGVSVVTAPHTDKAKPKHVQSSAGASDPHGSRAGGERGQSTDPHVG